MLFRPKDQRLSLTELTSSFKPYSSAHAPLRPLLVASLRTKRNSFRLFSCPALHGAGHAALTALPHYYQGPDFSPRLTKAFRSLPYSLAYPPALRPCGMNTIDRNATRSPQLRRFSFPPCRPHTPCLKARCASISFALRLQAQLSALMADRFASGLPLGYGPEIRRMPFGFHLAMDTLPSL